MIVFNLGYSHPMINPLPTGGRWTRASTQADEDCLTGIDRQQVGQVAADNCVAASARSV